MASVETETTSNIIDPNALLVGWLVGKHIAAQRNEEPVSAELINGILYIKNAPATLTDGILEVK